MVDDDDDDDDDMIPLVVLNFAPKCFIHCI